MHREMQTPGRIDGSATCIPGENVPPYERSANLVHHYSAWAPSKTHLASPTSSISYTQVEGRDKTGSLLQIGWEPATSPNQNFFSLTAETSVDSHGIMASLSTRMRLSRLCSKMQGPLLVSRPKKASTSEIEEFNDCAAHRCGNLGSVSRSPLLQYSFQPR